MLSKTFLLTICATLVFAGDYQYESQQTSYKNHNNRIREHRRNRRNCPDAVDSRSAAGSDTTWQTGYCPTAKTLAQLVETNTILAKQNAYLLNNCVRPQVSRQENRYGDDDSSLSNIDSNRNWGLTLASQSNVEESFNGRPLNFDQDKTNNDNAYINNNQQPSTQSPLANSRDQKACIVAFIMCCDSPNAMQCLDKFQCRNYAILSKCTKEKVDSLSQFVTNQYHLIA